MRDYVILYLFIVMRSDNIYFIAKRLVQNMFKNIRKYEKKKICLRNLIIFNYRCRMESSMRNQKYQIA